MKQLIVISILLLSLLGASAAQQVDASTQLFNNVQRANGGTGYSTTNLCLTSDACLASPEGSTPPTPAVGFDFIYFSAVYHWLLFSGNGSTLEPLAGMNGVFTPGNLVSDLNNHEFQDSGIVGTNLVSAAGTLTSTQPLCGSGSKNLQSCDLTGDATTSGSAVTVVAKINGTTVPTNAAANQIPVTTSSAVVAWKTLVGCSTLATQSMVFNATGHSFGCNTPAVGQKTTSYTSALGDENTLWNLLAGTPQTWTLPAVAPAAGWWEVLQNTGAGTWTVSPNGLLIDGGSGNLSLAQNQGMWIWSNGTNYFTFRGVTGAGPGTVLNLYTEAAVAGNGATGVNGSPVNMFTGYTLPSSTLVAGHRLVVTGCYQHTTGTASTAYRINFGLSVTTAVGANTATGYVCTTFDIVAIDSTHQTMTERSTSNMLGGALATQGPTFLVQNLATTLAVNFSFLESVNNTDVSTGYMLTVELY